MHVPPGLDPAVRAQPDAPPQVVHHQHLLRLGQADLPGAAGVLDRRERAGAGAPVVAGDEDVVGVGFGHAGGDRANPALGHQLDPHLGPRVRRLQVVDQLGQVLDAVDVVVGRGRDQGDAGDGVTQAGDHGRHLVRRELPALAGLGALGDLDLQLLGVLQVLRRDPEARGRHLLALAVGPLAGERAVRERLPPGRVLATFAGVRPARRCGSWPRPAWRGPPARGPRATWPGWRSGRMMLSTGSTSSTGTAGPRGTRSSTSRRARGAPACDRSR